MKNEVQEIRTMIESMSAVHGREFTDSDQFMVLVEYLGCLLIESRCVGYVG